MKGNPVFNNNINTTGTGTEKRRNRQADPVLYPHLRAAGWRPATRWGRLWWHLTGDARDANDLQVGGRAIGRYHHTLAMRSRWARESHAYQGWWPGPAPYGYHLTQHRVDDEHGREPVWRRRLAIDPRRAPSVPVIYGWSVHDRLSDTAIAVRLAAEHRPPPIDHVTGRVRAWSPAAVRTILTNPAYLGYVVCRRSHRGRPQPPERWLWSPAPAHPALIEVDLFWASHHRHHRPDTPAGAAVPAPTREATPGESTGAGTAA